MFSELEFFGQYKIKDLSFILIVFRIDIVCPEHI